MLDAALNNERERLFQAMAVVNLAADATGRLGSPIDGSLSVQAVCEVWSALNGAYNILNGIAARMESSATLAGMEDVRHG